MIQCIKGTRTIQSEGDKMIQQYEAKGDGDIIIKCGAQNMHLHQVHDLLKQTVWAFDRPKDVIEKSMNHSLCYGVFLKADDRQIGFARVITDYTTHYYLCDVVIDTQYRKKGIGKKMLQAILENKEFDGMLGMLITEEAEGFYQPYGFRTPDICFMMKSRKQD